MRLFGLVMAVIAAGGCAHYAPAPIDIAAMTRQPSAASIDAAGVAREIARIAPSYVWDGRSWNDLTLLAAALVHNPEVAAARSAARAAAADARAARVGPGSSLTLSAEYAFNPAESSPWLFGIAADQLLDIGGRRKARIAAADLADRAAAFDFAEAAWKTRQSIRVAMIALAGASEANAAYAELAPIRARQLEALRNQVSEGAASNLDLEQARASAAADVAGSAEADAALAAARLDLAAAIGVVPAAIDATKLHFGVSKSPSIPTPTGDERAAAMLARPELLRAMTAYDQAEEALRAAVAAQYPELRLGPGYTWERGLSKLPFALNLTFPSRDFNAAAIKAAEAHREESGRRLEAVVAAMGAAIDRAYADYAAAETRVALLTREATLPAQAIAAQADRAIEAGAIDRVGWAAAKSGYLAAKRDEALARRDLAIAQAALEGALRRPLAGPETTIVSEAIKKAGATQ